MPALFKDRLQKILSNDYILSVFFLIVFLCTNAYIFAWDDQHLEIPLLKHLIDPSLYGKDYYVQSLAHNFSSYFYPLLAKLIKTSQVQGVYWVLFLISRYAMFFFLYKLWKLLSKDSFSAACAVLMFILLGRTEEFLYRTFSHQEAGEAFMFAALYLFYREKYLLAAFVFGLGANIHALYNLFPMLFMLSFLLIFHQQRWSMVFKSGLVFVVSSLPFLLWQIPKSFHEKLSGAVAIPTSEWMPLYQASCPQNFLFPNYASIAQAFANRPFFIECVEPFVFLSVVYLVLLIYPAFRADKKTQVLVGVSVVLISLSTFFSYAIPSRFVIDLNLVRCEQFIRLFLMAYMSFWAISVVREGKLWQALGASVVFLFVGFGNFLQFGVKLEKNIWVITCMACVFFVLSIRSWGKFEPWLRRTLIILPLLGSFIGFCKFYYQFVQVKDHGGGFWQMHRNWIDMQLYVRDHTPQNAFILTPVNEDMGGFRIQSERSVVVCNRDCGIIGFDYKAAIEWRKRINELKGFVTMTDQPVDRYVLTAIMKYKVDYIVFMKYYEPKGDNPVLKKVYENEVFSLFRVAIQP